jgi:isoamylase
VGTLVTIPAFWSPQLGNSRDVLVYLPPNYTESDARYPVIYMHYGQNLFDETTSYAGEWYVDETMERLGRRGRPAIVVGIPNMGERRLDEYGPFVDSANGGGQGDAYLSFVADTIKPYVDRAFRTRADRDHTGIFGSSMGGLISLYAFFRRPEVFGFVGAMSPAFWFADGAIFPFVEGADAPRGRVYMDVGTGERERTVESTRRMRALLAAKGYRPGRRMKYVEERDAPHNEAAWARRLPGALAFLLNAAAEAAL